MAQPRSEQEANYIKLSICPATMMQEYCEAKAEELVFFYTFILF
jgi:hypothetical protein